MTGQSSPPPGAPHWRQQPHQPPGQAVRFNGRTYKAVIGVARIVITGADLDVPDRGDASDFSDFVADHFDAAYDSVREQVGDRLPSRTRAIAHVIHAMHALDVGFTVSDRGVVVRLADAGDLDQIVAMVRETVLNEQWIRDQIAHSADR